MGKHKFNIERKVKVNYSWKMMTTSGNAFGDLTFPLQYLLIGLHFGYWLYQKMWYQQLDQLLNYMTFKLILFDFLSKYGTCNTYNIYECTLSTVKYFFFFHLGYNISFSNNDVPFPMKSISLWFVCQIITNIMDLSSLFT